MKVLFVSLLSLCLFGGQVEGGGDDDVGGNSANVHPHSHCVLSITFRRVITFSK